ncbi:MAG: helix-turn-helix domain-containing protein [Clostridiales bacterium]|nr:helix-turn-helix domain-containing protein [Clostridiales bacterium]
MSEITVEIGKRIRNFRKTRKMTLDDLSTIICKSKSTISKYEKGEISIDIETMYDIASALHVHVEQLLYCPPDRVALSYSDNHPAFFNGVSQFYSYLFDGRNNRIIRSVFDVLSKSEHDQYKIMMYMNFSDYEHYTRCENTYYGYIEHFDAVTNISLTNQDTPMERASVQILASFLDSDTKWGLWNGFSSRPIMPIATKMLFSKTPLKENYEFAKSLKISKEDIRLLKLYNMLSVL